MKIDMHVHTKYSSCSNLEPSVIEKVALKMGLDAVVITDHNEIKGYRACKRTFKDIGVIPGTELRTNQGEIITLFLDKALKRDMDFFEAVDMVRDMGGMVVAPHPFDPFRGGIGSLCKDVKADAIEVFNSRAPFPFINKMAENFARKNRLSGVVGSDAHFASELGNAVVEVKGSSQDDLRKAIKSGRIKVVRRRYGPPTEHLKTVLVKFGVEL